ncbi:hypothetical protein LDL08_16055 [Nonomuraea glycinis]|uniref:Uncharacterized protein n=1 Tax=Nonomuraea glycinis TaxID=2047744 RepID=A0A918A752_9ACTN|nr:hypothetical protein [Nonomuraea glycinis]MCA2177703.1 hypothetical protein [Nonomuraea glycinis]GGP06797.1 hypothetical protein GCM10012278_32220 [Nonomuraea glycinis]
MSVIAEIITFFTEEDDVKDLYGVFDIGVDEEELRGEPSPWAVIPPGPEERANGGPNAVMLQRSWEAASYVRYELWDGEPSADHSWGHAWIGEVYLSTGRISAMSMVPGFTHHHTVFDLGRRATTWRLRVQWKFLDNDREPLFPRYIYQVDLFTLQFWPPPS